MIAGRTESDRVGAAHWLGAWLTGGLWDRDRIQATFDRQWDSPHAFPRFLARMHVACAFYWCFVVSWPTTSVELAVIPVTTCCLLRLRWTWRLYKEFLTQPLVVVGAAFLLWQGVSLLWTLDLHEGIKQAGTARFAWSLAAMWPVIQHRPRLIAALALGFVCGNFSQLLHGIGTHWGIEAIRWDRAVDRNSGWWKPVVGGSLLVAALGLHLPAALRGVGRERWFGLAGSALTLIGIFATGSRGAWAAALALITLAGLVGVWSAKNKRRAVVAVVTGVAVIAIACAIAWPRISPAIDRRWELAKAEVSAALDKGDYASDTGARIAMAIWAARAFEAHPIVGVGAGGYRAWVDKEQKEEQQQGRERGVSATASTAQVHAHAHNALLQVAATTGIIGLSLALAAIVIALRNAACLASIGSGGYAAGPLYALLGLLLVSPFDPIHINSQTAALLALLFSLCPTWLPARKSGNSQLRGDGDTTHRQQPERRGLDAPSP